MEKDKPYQSVFRRLRQKSSDEKKGSEETKSDKQSLDLKPAMPELGTAPCPICQHPVCVFVTRTKRPFINCGYCSARIFYNGSRSMQLLQKQIKAPKKAL
jgi:DNA-directed RNA polymerase subunit RPC12/RpoP